ncbi:MAG: hypothetical protein LAO24_24205 [Acidobacteriia bacterium]|nr:hypothetical protein [Terriglobia bacterium]
MENSEFRGGFIASTHRDKDDHVQQVVQQAHEELRHLMQQRAELVKRIGTVKQTILGLARLFGTDVLSKELLDMVAEQKSKGSQPGFTKTCRMILMESERPMSARDVCIKIHEVAPTVPARHKDLIASVTTVLNRLADYGEAEAVALPNGRRAWQWIAQRKRLPAAF